MVSVGEVRSGERTRVLCRLVWDVPRASLDELGCLVCIRRGCAPVGFAEEVNDGVRFERAEGLRKVCRN
jgi:hypothetical protein